MRIVELRLTHITVDEQDIVLALNDNRSIQKGEYYLSPKQPPFTAIQRALEPQQILFNQSPVIEACTEPKYGLPDIPEVLVKRYFENKQLNNKATLRLPDLPK